MRGIGVVDVAQAIEPGVEGADEVAGRVIDGGRKPALGVVAELFTQHILAGDAAQRGDRINEDQRKRDVDGGGDGEMPERPEAGIECDPFAEKAHDPHRDADQKLARTGDKAE